MEIDTTQLFNSPLKATQTKTSAGGVVEFTPGLTFRDSTVYYWRTAAVPANQDAPVWSSASFTYIPGSGTGFRQSHYYQLNENLFNDLYYKEDGVFLFDSSSIRLSGSIEIVNLLVPLSLIGSIGILYWMESE